ncbi:MAG: hypothetical protein WBM50_00765 [Acidimicrobiales bacterium]
MHIENDNPTQEPSPWPNDPAPLPFEGSTHEYGAGLAEYALLLLLIALACIGALTALAPPISNIYNQVSGLL